LFDQISARHDSCEGKVLRADQLKLKGPAFASRIATTAVLEKDKDSFPKGQKAPSQEALRVESLGFAVKRESVGTA
jgi:hypothetical protein